MGEVKGMDLGVRWVRVHISCSPSPAVVLVFPSVKWGMGYDPCRTWGVVEDGEKSMPPPSLRLGSAPNPYQAAPGTLGVRNGQRMMLDP